MTTAAASRSSLAESEVRGSDSVQGSVGGAVKLSMQRLKPAVNKYCRVLDSNVHRLHQHRANMRRLLSEEQWAGLHQEQVNATGTVQQVKATLQELGHTRWQVLDNQVATFDAHLQEVKVKVMAAIDSFLVADDAAHGASDVRETNNPHTQTSPLSSTIPNNSRAAASRQQLTQELEELQHLVNKFTATCLESHDETDNGNEAGLDPVTSDPSSHSKARRLQMAVFPVVGALIGGAVAGPVGLFAGIKIGGLAGAVGGGVAGLAGGTILKSQSKSSGDLCNSSQASDITPTSTILSSQSVEVIHHHTNANNNNSDDQDDKNDTDNDDDDDNDEAEDQSLLSQFLSWGQPRK